MRLGALLMLLAALAACNATLPDDGVQGEWGGTGFLISMTEAKVTAQLTCLKAEFPGPLLPEDDGTFSLTGEVTLVPWPPDIGQPAELNGRFVDDVLHLSFRYFTSGGEWTLLQEADDLRLGSPAIWTDTCIS